LVRMNKKGKKATIDDEKPRPVKKPSYTRLTNLEVTDKKRSADKRQPAKITGEMLIATELPLDPALESKRSQPIIPTFPPKRALTPVANLKKPEAPMSPKPIASAAKVKPKVKRSLTEDKQIVAKVESKTVLKDAEKPVATKVESKTVLKDAEKPVVTRGESKTAVKDAEKPIVENKPVEKPIVENKPIVKDAEKPAVEKVESTAAVKDSEKPTVAKSKASNKEKRVSKKEKKSSQKDKKASQKEKKASQKESRKASRKEARKASQKEIRKASKKEIRKASQKENKPIVKENEKVPIVQESLPEISPKSDSSSSSTIHTPKNSNRVVNKTPDTTQTKSDEVVKVVKVPSETIFMPTERRTTEVTASDDDLTTFERIKGLGISPFQSPMDAKGKIIKAVDEDEVTVFEKIGGLGSSPYKSPMESKGKVVISQLPADSKPSDQKPDDPKPTEAQDEDSAKRVKSVYIPYFSSYMG